MCVCVEWTKRERSTKTRVGQRAREISEVEMSGVEITNPQDTLLNRVNGTDSNVNVTKAALLRVL